jgi:signal transduction histidine kinase
MPKAIDELKTTLAQLLSDAETGNIIPISLPRQIAAIQQQIFDTEKEYAEEIEELKSRPTGDAGEIITENAAFMKTAIHELRTPMTSIRGYGDMLANQSMSGELNEMQSELLKVVRSNSKRMEALLSDMSYINKLRGGIMAVSKQMNMFKNIAMMAEKNNRHLAEELNRQLEFDIPQGLPILTTDGDLMAHAMSKLIENGLRYSAEGEGKVTVRGDKQDNTLLVIIEDNGCGITEEEMTHLGELFFRSDNETVLKYKGSGLGVYIAYGLVDIIGGRHEVKSTPGGGTTFTLFFDGMS